LAVVYNKTIAVVCAQAKRLLAIPDMEEHADEIERIKDTSIDLWYLTYGELC